MIKENVFLLSVTQKVIFFLIIIIFLIFVFIIIKNIIIDKKINKKISDICEKSGYILKKKYDSADFLIQRNNSLVKLLIVKIPKNSSITVNSKLTWCLRWGGKRVGRSYPNMRYMNEVISFLKSNSDSKMTKLVALYPETEKIQKYLNESEIAVVNSGECVYDYVIINFNDLDSFLKKNDN